MANRAAAMNIFEFTLILAGVAEITPDLADALYAATGGDIELNMVSDWETERSIEPGLA